MRVRLIPGVVAIAALATGAGVALLALLFGASMSAGAILGAAWCSALTAAAVFDYFMTHKRWRAAQPQLVRRLPPALALGVKRPVHLTISLGGDQTWQCRLYDHVDATLLTEGMPVTLTLQGGANHELAYNVTPTRRGEVRFAPADIRIRSQWRFWELIDHLGDEQTCRVYPDFAQVARYAWLAGDRRLSEIGIKTYQQRGEGTDFKQLSEYRSGDPIRHIDWRATLRLEKLIVREFQSERDQCVLLLIDCGRRMRADDRTTGIGSSHFDQVLNAVMLLAYVALKQGDAVGALTFGTPVGEQRWFAPRKGASTLDALMSELYAVQPSPTHSDYLGAARDLVLRYNRRALVVLITNFRDEIGEEFGRAVSLLSRRHLVLPASLRERSSVNSSHNRSSKAPQATIRFWRWRALICTNRRAAMHSTNWPPTTRSSWMRNRTGSASSSPIVINSSSALDASSGSLRHCLGQLRLPGF